MRMPDQELEADIDRAFSEALGDSREERGEPAALYADLVRVHVENGVLMAMMLLLLANSVVLLVMLPWVATRDTYVVPGPVQAGDAYLVWGQTVSEEAKAELAKVVAERRVVAAQQAEREASRERASYESIDATGVRTADESAAVDAMSAGSQRPVKQGLPPGNNSPAQGRGVYPVKKPVDKP